MKQENSEIDKSSYARLGIECLLCGSVRVLTREEAEYHRYFGTVASIYICNRCKNAIKWATERMEGE